jgi:hypothetical protein
VSAAPALGCALSLSLLLAARAGFAHPAAFHEQPAALGAVATALQYLRLGFLHIVPQGRDHVLFVLGLFLSGCRLKRLLLQLTAFTLAHTLTLALAALGWLWAPPRLIEPLIALSIVYVALENVMFGAGRGERVLAVFLFGLLHGLGFAGALSELGLPDARFALALVTFNVGVELGQLSVVLTAGVALALARWRRWRLSGFSRIASAALALVGLYWVVERSIA